MLVKYLVLDSTAVEYGIWPRFSGQILYLTGQILYLARQILYLAGQILYLKKKTRYRIWPENRGIKSGHTH